MNNMEFNKIFAAVLVAGIIAMLSGFVSEKVYHPKKLKENAVKIEGVEAAGSSGPKKVAKADPILHLIAEADIERGQKLSKACAACHSFDNGGPNGVGPNLWNVVGAKKGSHAGFGYSDAMTSKGGDWAYVELNQFLWKPKKFVEGTKMNFIGLKKPEDRAALIAWLRTKSSSPKALPSAGQIQAELDLLGPDEEEAAAEASVEEPAHH